VHLIRINNLKKKNMDETEVKYRNENYHLDKENVVKNFVIKIFRGVEKAKTIDDL